MNYKGFLIDGTVFDSNEGRGAPFSFILEAGQVIKGFDIAVASMKVGEKSKFLIKSEYAYGANSPSPSIPSNSDLIFELELLEIDNKKDKNELTITEKLAAADQAKSDGSFFFKEGKIAKAISEYKYGCDLVADYQDWSDEFQDEAQTLFISLSLNLALALIKNQEYLEACSQAMNVLALDKHNFKAIYRFGLAKLHLGDAQTAIDLLQKTFGQNIPAELADVYNKLAQAKANAEEKTKNLYSKMMAAFK